MKSLVWVSGKERNWEYRNLGDVRAERTWKYYESGFIHKKVGVAFLAPRMGLSTDCMRCASKNNYCSLILDSLFKSLHCLPASGLPKKRVELLSVLVYDKKKLTGAIGKDETSKKDS